MYELSFHLSKSQLLAEKRTAAISICCGTSSAAHVYPSLSLRWIPRATLKRGSIAMLRMLHLLELELQYAWHSLLHPRCSGTEAVLKRAAGVHFASGLPAQVVPSCAGRWCASSFSLAGLAADVTHHSEPLRPVHRGADRVRIVHVRFHEHADKADALPVVGRQRT